MIPVSVFGLHFALNSNLHKVFLEVSERQRESKTRGKGDECDSERVQLKYNARASVRETKSARESV